MDAKMVSNLPIFLDALKEQVEKALEMCGMTAEGYAKRNCPVDTGALRNSISHSVDVGKGEAYVGTNMEYAIYVEHGTGTYASGGRKTPWVYQDEKGNWHQTNGQPPRPFIKPAATDHGSEYVKIIESVLRGG